MARLPLCVAPAVRVRYDPLVGRFATGLSLTLLLTLAGSSPSQTSAGLRLRASAGVAPCVRSAAAGFETGGLSITIDEGDLGDLVDEQLLAGSGVEITRAIEAGLAVEGTDVDLARIPWVLRAPPSGPQRLEDLAGRGGRIVLLGGAESYEARRALGGLPSGRVSETTDPETLRAAPLAVVPLSLAGKGPHQLLDISPILARAALTRHDTGEGRRFLDYLTSEPGLKRFVACEVAERP
jgi:hypothetical protein